ncbi:hypothetical protein [Parasitella parasitica]|uniref:Uncharacterized protein n=1 Tax=Parasitella parasitica TaxID=35722 RepID=A0A0B7NGX1_9FUNG|nr:hypothetical protein [Parasitella parasitica]
MRVQQALQGNNPILADELERFFRYLLQIGEGTAPTVSLPGNIPSGFIPILIEIHFKSSNLLELIRAVYADINNSSVGDQYFAGRVILTPKNKNVAVINKLILDFMPNRKITYYSRDQICDPVGDAVIPEVKVKTVLSSPDGAHASKFAPITLQTPLSVRKNNLVEQSLVNKVSAVGASAVGSSYTGSYGVCASGPSDGGKTREEHGVRTDKVLVGKIFQFDRALGFSAKHQNLLA